MSTIVQTLLSAIFEHLLEALLKLGWIKTGTGKDRVAKCPSCGSIRIKRATGRWFQLVAFLPIVLGAMLFTVLWMGGLVLLVVGLLNLIGTMDTTGGRGVDDVLYLLGGIAAILAAIIMLGLWSRYMSAKDPVECRDCGYHWPAREAGRSSTAGSGLTIAADAPPAAAKPPSAG